MFVTVHGRKNLWGNWNIKRQFIRDITMSKFVFSSFVIGVGTSAFVSLAVNERLFERKLMFQPKENTDELVQAYYEQVTRPQITFWSRCVTQCISAETSRKNSREATAAKKVTTTGIAREVQLWSHSGHCWCLKQALLEVSPRNYRWNQQQVQVNELVWIISPQKWVYSWDIDGGYRNCDPCKKKSCAINTLNNPDINVLSLGQSLSIRASHTFSVQA